MKPGFLNTPNAKKRHDHSAQSLPRKVEQKVMKLSHGVVPEAGALPEGYKPPEIHYREFHGHTMNYQPDEFIITAVPPIAMGTELADFEGGWAECFVSGHVKRLIYTTPGFPSLPLVPVGGKQNPTYRIDEASGGKGLGMFAARLLRPGDLIIDERPMLVASNTVFGTTRSQAEEQLTHEQKVQISLAQWGDKMKLLFERMPPENQKAFMALANSHEHDGSGDFFGRIRTNGIGCDFRDKDTTGNIGRYSAVCKDISRINHSCCPNAVFRWHTESFSVRIYAVREIPANAEVTISYCDDLAPAAERATSLAPYGIISCDCSPSCSDPARSKLGDERRSRFRNPLVLMPPFEKPKPGELEDAWAEPAVTRLQELEEEGLEGTRQYKDTAYQLVNIYTFLQDVDKVIFYANKLKGIYKVLEKKDLLAMHLSEEGIKGSPFYLMGEMKKKMPGMPIMVSFG